MIDEKRYEENPSFLFFEYYILNTIGLISKEKYDEINNLEINQMFGTEKKEWTEIVIEVFKLSNTIDFAILDLWFINRANLLKQNIEYSPLEYSINFVDEYYKKDSKIDKWTEESIKMAALRIKENIEIYRENIEKAKEMLKNGRIIEEIKKETILYEAEIKML